MGGWKKEKFYVFLIFPEPVSYNDLTAEKLSFCIIFECAGQKNAKKMFKKLN